LPTTSAIRFSAVAGPANISGSNAMTAASARQVPIQLDSGRRIPGAFPKISGARLAAGACHASTDTVNARNRFEAKAKPLFIGREAQSRLDNQPRNATEFARCMHAAAA
jgi:hypothetical protein